MKIGLQLPRFDWPGSPNDMGPKLVEIAKASEGAGFSSLWVMDHFFELVQGDGPITAPMLEGFSTISYLAAVTKKIKVGLLVAGNIYRHPGLLIKTVTTLDIISGGRACFGIGAGWYVRESKGLGIPFPKNKRELFGRLEEALQIAMHMWSGNPSPYEGRYYRLEEPINIPQPISKPHPPILIGGSGEKKTLKLVAKYGNACNLWIGAPFMEYPPGGSDRFRKLRDRLALKIDILRQHCRNVGRSFNDIECTVLGSVRIGPEATSPAEVVDLCLELAGLGFSHAIFNMPNDHEIWPIKAFGREVIPQVKNI